MARGKDILRGKRKGMTVAAPGGPSINVGWAAAQSRFRVIGNAVERAHADETREKQSAARARTRGRFPGLTLNGGCSSDRGTQKNRRGKPRRLKFERSENQET